jgi:ABC-type transport system involved in multi-copper enzyme maturation permease subunit
MIWKIAKKEFLLSIITFKFALGTIVCVVLTAVFVPILAKDYQQRVKTYHENVARNEAELRKVMVYMNITPTIFRKPSVMSVFGEGLEKRIAESVTIELDKVPEMKAAAAQGNPYQAIFSIFDTLLIFKIVIGVLALLFAYDAVSGERERGTLKMMLSGTTRRYEVLMGKLLSGLLVLVVPVTIVFILGLIILLSFPLIDLTGSDWVLIGFMYLASLVFISVMYNMGLLFSCLTKRSSISLVLGLFLWIIFAVVIPNGSVYLAAEMRQLQSSEKMEAQITSIKQEYQAELDENKVNRTYQAVQSDATDAFGRGYKRLLHRTFMEYLQESYRLQYPVKIRYADRFWEVEHSYFNSMYEQKKLADTLSRISPVSLYENVMSSLAGTDIAVFQRFMESVRMYRSEILEYVRSKTEGFSSSSFFTPCTKEEVEQYEKLMTQLQQVKSPEEAKSIVGKAKEHWEKVFAETPSLDLRDFPAFKSPSTFGNLERAVPDLGLLIFVDVLFFAVAFTAFARYDIR